MSLLVPQNSFVLKFGRRKIGVMQFELELVHTLILLFKYIISFFSAFNFLISEFKDTKKNQTKNYWCFKIKRFKRIKNLFLINLRKIIY
jgi:hypothetical protein